MASALTLLYRGLHWLERDGLKVVAGIYIGMFIGSNFHGT